MGPPSTKTGRHRLHYVPGHDLGSLAYRLDVSTALWSAPACTAPHWPTGPGHLPEGTLRFSFGYFNTEHDVLYSLDALKNLTA